MEVYFREAGINDCNKILNFIKEIAHYEKLDNEVVAKIEDIENALFIRKIGKVIFLMKEKQEIGFVLFYYNFSTFTGKLGIHLEDFFIYEKYRHRGYGKMLFKEVIKIAKKDKCPRVEWTCLNWNSPSIKFYESMGAISLSDWKTFRLTFDKYDSVLLK